MTLSVILPTVRPNMAPRAIESIVAAAGAVPIEVVVVADFQPEQEFGDRVRWTVAPREGVVAAVNVGYKLAQGDFVFLTNDQTTFGFECLALMVSTARSSPPSLLTPTHHPSFNFAYYGKPFAAFPFAHRDTYERLGGMLDPAYKAFYSDPDLSLRAHDAGIPVREVAGADLFHRNIADGAKNAAVSEWFAKDQATFRSRWDHLGVFRDP